MGGRYLVILCFLALMCAIPASAGAAVGGGREPRDINTSTCEIVKLDARAHSMYRRGVPCTWAKGWIRKMATTRGRSRPGGWVCSSGDGFRRSGYCERGNRHFGWEPVQ